MFQKNRKRPRAVNKSKENVINKTDIIKIFSEIQYNTNNHDSNLRKLKNILEKLPFDDFMEQFLQCVFIVLKIGEKNEFVDRSLLFSAKFCNYLNSESTENNSLNTSFIMILNALLKYHDSNLDDIRFRVCDFISVLLNEMGENASLDEDLCSSIINAMLERMKDIKPQVRTQAVKALHRLQSCNDPTDPVMKTYVFHMEYDPSPQVRRAVINSIACKSENIPYILKRIKDVDEKVRRDAYLFLSKFRIQHLKISQRQNILSTGLGDRSLSVKKVVTQKLIPKWLSPYKQNVFKFMECIVLDGDEKQLKESINVLEIVLDFYFRNNTIEDNIEILQLNDKKLISLVKLESVIYWKCLTFFLEKQNNQDYLESILPDLSCFCDLIKEYISSQKKDLKNWEFIGYQFTLLSLLNMLHLFDMSDEVGRINLKKLIVDILMKEKLLSIVVKKIIAILSTCFFKENEFLEEITFLISDLMEPIQVEYVPINEGDQMILLAKSNEIRVKLFDLVIQQENAVAAQDFETALKLKSEIQEIEVERDKLKEKTVVQKEIRKRVTEPEIVCKALDIIINVFILQQTKKLHPCLRTLQKEFVFEYCTKYENPKIQKRALQIIALCGYLDLNIAKTISKIFYAQIMAFKFGNVGSIDVLLVSISGMVDFLLLYGFDEFSNSKELDKKDSKSLKRTLYDVSQADISGINLNEISDENNDTTFKLSQDSEIFVNSKELIITLTSFLEHEDMALRTKTAECFCKLFISGHIKSVSLLSRLIILWFNPATEQDVELRQILGIMLTLYGQKIEGSQEIFAAAYLPTLKTLCDAPLTSPLHSIDINIVIKYFVTHTSPEFSCFDNVIVHNYLAFQIFEELQKSPKDKHTIWLLKTLLILNISKLDKTFQAELIMKANNLLEILTNKTHIKVLNKVIFRINNRIDIVEEITNIECESQKIIENNVQLIVNESSGSQNIIDVNCEKTTKKNVILCSESESDRETSTQEHKKPCRRSKRLQEKNV